MGPNQIASRSRSAASPALPTAATTRPQLASSPATAVLTRGELAIDSAMRFAATSLSAPSTVTETNLRAPSPSLTTRWARSSSSRSSAAAKPASRGSAGSEMAGAPRSAAPPVAKSIRVSDVEVSLSTVMQLNEVSTPRDSRACSTGAAMGASVKTKLSMVAMSGAIMPAPLAMPLRVTGTPPRSTVAVASLGKVSVVMMARAASAMPSSRASATSRSSTPSKRVASSGSPMTPVEARKISPAGAPLARPAISAVRAVEATPVRPVKALALPELTTSSRAFPPPSLARHQSTGAEGQRDLVNTPATAVFSGMTATVTSVRPL